MDLVYRGIAWAVMGDLLLGAADAYGKGLSCHPRHRAYTGYLEKIGDVLGIIDLVEEHLLVGIDIHAHHKRYLELIGMSCLARPCVTPGVRLS